MFKYFEKVKKECIRECKNTDHKSILKYAFEKPEIADLFLKLEKSDPAHIFMRDVIMKYVRNFVPKTFYIPGAGTGALSRNISNHYKNSKFIEVDQSSQMSNKNTNKDKELFETYQDNINSFQYKDKYDVIVAYSVSRYNDPKELLEKWYHETEKNGIVIFGEAGINTNKINHPDYKVIGNFNQEGKVFRASLFYMLLKRFEEDVEFNTAVLQVNTNYATTLKNIAKRKKTTLYARVMQKL